MASDLRDVERGRRRGIWDRLLWQVLEPRARGIHDWLAPMLRGLWKIGDEGPLRFLDIGAGTGNVASRLQREGHAVVPIDVEDLWLAPSTEMQPMLFDGRRIPFGDRSFDVALLITVLHHADAPDTLLAEAARVADYVLVLEDVVRGPWHRRLTTWVDSLLNLEFRGHPHNNRTDAGWRASLEAVGLQLIGRQERWSFGVMWQVAYLARVSR